MTRLRVLAFPIALVPIVAGFLYVAAYGVNVPVQDDWGTVINLSEEAAGTLSLSDLFAAHNEQRILFPRLAELLLAKAGGYSTLAEMYVIEASFLATLGALVLMMWRTLGREAVLLVPVVAYLVFSVRQSEVMLLGFNISFAFCAMFGVVALALLWFSTTSSGRGGIAAFAGALASATVAAYSSSQGLTVWLAGLVLLVLAGKRRHRRGLLAIWSLAGIGAWIIFFQGYETAPGHPSSTYALHHPLVGLRYYLTLVGASLTVEPTRALVYGILLITLAVGALALTARRRETEQMSFWIALLAFWALAMLTITIGRAGFGVTQALTSRYATFSLVGVVAVLALLVPPAFRDRSRAAIALLAASVVLIALSLPGTIGEGIRDGRHTSIERKRAAYILSTYRSQPDALLRDVFQPTAIVVRQFAPFLERRNYTVFGASQPPAPPPPPPSPAELQADQSPSSCTLDSINGAPAGDRPNVSLDRGYLVVSGWCLAPGNRRLAGGVNVVLDGRYVPAYYGQYRPDVADFFDRRTLVHAGFEAAVRMPPGAKGAHSVAVVALSRDRKRYYQPTPTFTFRIT